MERARAGPSEPPAPTRSPGYLPVMVTSVAVSEPAVPKLALADEPGFVTVPEPEVLTVTVAPWVTSLLVAAVWA